VKLIVLIDLSFGKGFFKIHKDIEEKIAVFIKDPFSHNKNIKHMCGATDFESIKLGKIFWMAILDNLTSFIKWPNM